MGKSKKDDIRYNGSGYYDDTAYKAMRSMYRGGSAMQTYNRGEIWEIEMPNGGTREAVLVRCFEDYASVLMLMDSQPSHTYMAIKSQDLKYVDCGKLGYCYYDRLTNFVRTLSDSEIAELMERIVGALELDIPVTEATATVETGTIVPEPAADPGIATQEQKALQESVSEAHKLLMDSAVSLEGMTRERDVYKGLFNQLLEKILP